MRDFYLQGHDHVALCDLLKLAGAAESGGRAKQLITEGRVLRNGEPELRKTAKITAGEIISLGDCVLQVKAGDDA